MPRARHRFHAGLLGERGDPGPGSDGVKPRARTGVDSNVLSLQKAGETLPPALSIVRTHLARRISFGSRFRSRERNSSKQDPQAIDRATDAPPAQDPALKSVLAGEVYEEKSHENAQQALTRHSRNGAEQDPHDDQESPRQILGGSFCDFETGPLFPVPPPRSPREDEILLGQMDHDDPDRQNT